jgi:hypothetical protein
VPFYPGREFATGIRGARGKFANQLFVWNPSGGGEVAPEWRAPLVPENVMTLWFRIQPLGPVQNISGRNVQLSVGDGQTLCLILDCNRPNSA